MTTKHHHILQWVCAFWFPSVTDSRENLELFLRLIETWIRTRGLLWTIKRVKLLRLIVTRYIAGQPLKVVNDLVGIDSTGFPKCLGFLKPWANGSTSEIKLLLTFLGVSRSFKFEQSPDYSSITDGFRGTTRTIRRGFVRVFIRDFDLRDEIFPKDYSNGLHYLSNKAGPAGPATLSAHLYLDIMPDKLLGSLGALTSDELVLAMHALAGGIQQVQHKLAPARYQTLRRLAVVHDPEAKARIIGIVDYWSQLALKTLNTQVQRILVKKFPQDRTVTQAPFLAPKPGHRFWSFDLTSATDRFPIDLQVELLRQLVSKNFAYAWKTTMVGLPFLTREKTLVEYKVGQPIGARSSWVMFTLGHHLVVQYAAYLVGKYPTRDYILLGDDIVIRDDDIAMSYQKVIGDLGVGISPHKTHVSLTTYEFAKRWFHNGVEVTGVPLAGLVDNINQPTLVYGIVRSLYDRGYTPDRLSTAPGLVAKLYSLRRWPDRKVSSILNSLTVLNTLRRGDKATNEEMRSLLASAMRDSDCSLPADPVMLVDFFTRAGKVVLSDMANANISSLKAFQQTFISVLLKKTGYLNEIYFLTKDLPLTHGVYNALVAQMEAGSLLDKWENLGVSVEAVSIPDPVNLWEDRRSVQILLGMSKFAKGLFTRLQAPPGDEDLRNAQFSLQQAVVVAVSEMGYLRFEASKATQLKLQAAMASMYC